MSDHESLGFAISDQVRSVTMLAYGSVTPRRGYGGLVFGVTQDVVVVLEVANPLGDLLLGLREVDWDGDDPD